MTTNQKWNNTAEEHLKAQCPSRNSFFFFWSGEGDRGQWGSAPSRNSFDSTFLFVNTQRLGFRVFFGAILIWFCEHKKKMTQFYTDWAQRALPKDADQNALILDQKKKIL